jgi:hypothetical protein
VPRSLTERGRFCLSYELAYHGRALALRDHGVLIGTFFLRVTQHAAASLGGVPCGVQDRVRERRKGVFAADRTLLTFGAIRTSAKRPAILSFRSTAGSPRVSTRSIDSWCFPLNVCESFQYTGANCNRYANRGQFFRVISFLPMALALPIMRAETSACRRFWAALRKAAARQYLCICRTKSKAQWCGENLIRG